MEEQHQPTSEVDGGEPDLGYEPPVLEDLSTSHGPAVTAAGATMASAPHEM